MFDAHYSRRTFLPLTVLILLALAIMLVPFGASAAGSTPANRPSPHAITALPKPAVGTIMLTPTDTGKYTNKGFHNATNLNYLVGDCNLLNCYPPPNAHYRNFFVFDLGGVVGTITGATLVAADPFDNPPSAPYTLYAVQSSIAYVEADQRGATNIYHDLGAGTVYGSIIPADNTGSQTIPLNGYGVAAIRRAEAAQQQIVFGGDMPTPIGSNGYLFGGSGSSLTDVQLVLTVR
ncbi:MAG: hypothetical protein H0X37_24855 [Herpetosiphonaceae bacterium]|nr:hypothetical protein [Herpetosiphonaceae bacterium]